MSTRKVLSVVFAVVTLFLVVTTIVSADGGVAPTKFCQGGVAWVIRGQSSLVDPKCVGIYVLEIKTKQVRYSSFADAEKARAGRDATYWFEPSASQTVTPTASVRATVTTATVTSTPAQTVAVPVIEDRVARLISLDKVYRSKGWQAWLKEAGVVCDGVTVEARQPEEEIVSDSLGAHIVVSGLQVRGRCEIAYPVIVTTDRPGEVTLRADSRTYQPDPRNPSVLYTNVQLHGQGTIWVDGTNWGQLAPGIGTSEAMVNPTSTPALTNTPAPTATPLPTNSPAPTMTPRPTYTPYPTYTSYPTVRPEATSVPSSWDNESQVLPSNGRNFFNATVRIGAVDWFWWGIALIILAIVVGIVLLVVFIRWFVRRGARRFWTWVRGLFRRRTPAATPPAATPATPPTP